MLGNSFSINVGLSPKGHLNVKTSNMKTMFWGQTAWSVHAEIKKQNKQTQHKHKALFPASAR